MIWPTSSDRGFPECRSTLFLGCALILVLGVTGCADVRITTPRAFLGAPVCGTCDREGGKYGP